MAKADASLTYDDMVVAICLELYKHKAIRRENGGDFLNRLNIKFDNVETADVVRLAILNHRRQ